MDVYIINQELHREKQYQIMIKSGYGFNHVFPCKLFTLSEVKEICNKNNFNVIKTGSLWACI